MSLSTPQFQFELDTLLLKNQIALQYCQFLNNHSFDDINTLELKDKDFTNFKSFLKNNAFSFETDTEKALKKAFEISKKEELNDNIVNDYNTLLSNLNASKTNVLNENKAFLLKLLTEDIVKRYVGKDMHDQAGTLADGQSRVMVVPQISRPQTVNKISPSHREQKVRPQK